jgi:hypothetical protein
MVMTLCILGAHYLPMLAIPGLAFATFGAPTVISGVRSRDSFTQMEAHDASGGPQIGLEDTDYETGIALLLPQEDPMTVISMRMGKKTTGSIDYHWWADELMPETDTINYGTAYNQASTPLTVANGERFAVGDLVMVNVTREVMLVTAVAGDILTVTRDYGQSTEAFTAAASGVYPANGGYLTIIGNALEAGFPLPAIRTTTEQEFHNYCQDMRTPFGVTEIAEAARLRSGESDMTFQERKKGIEHSRKIELVNLWGKPAQGDKGVYASGTGNTAPSMAGGINYYINAFGAANQKIDETEITFDEFITNLEYVFEYGGDTKVCFCPPRFRTALDQWGLSKLNTFSTDTLFGINVDNWKSAHGNILFVTHKMLKNPETTDYLYMFFLEPSELQWVTYANIGNTRLRSLDPYAATGATLLEKEYETIFCLKFGAIPKHSRWRFKTIAA